jgi:hypothetical protein
VDAAIAKPKAGPADVAAIPMLWRRV